MVAFYFAGVLIVFGALLNWSTENKKEWKKDSFANNTSTFLIVCALSWVSVYVLFKEFYDKEI